MEEHPAVGIIVWSLLGYFLLQIVLNLRLRALHAAAPQDTARLRLSGALGNGQLNALYFIALSGGLILSGTVPAPALPQPLWLWLAAGLPGGLLLWALRIRLQGLGQQFSGGSTFVLPAEYVLRHPEQAGQFNRAVLLISLLEPLAQELFFRACFLSVMDTAYGRWPAIMATATLELLLRLNAAWALAILASSVLLSLACLAGGGPLATLCMALSAGFLHSYILSYQAYRSAQKSEPPA